MLTTTVTVCGALTAAGLAVAALTAWRRRFAAAARIAAYSLVPVGLALSGLVELAGGVGGAVADWATDLVLAPTVWAGFGVLAAAVVLLAAVRLAGRRPGGRGKGRTAGSGAPAPARGEAAGVRPRGHRTRSGEGVEGEGEDFSEIEAILRKHGI